MEDAASGSGPLAGWLCDDGGSMRAFFRVEEKDKLEAFVAECSPLEVIALYRLHADEAVDLAAALEIRAILEQIKEVAAIYPAADMPTPFQSVWQGCCEEIFFRATGCQWHMDEDDGRRRVDGPTAGQQIVERALVASEPSADAALRDATPSGTAG